jgi:hypothetical protein
MAGNNVGINVRLARERDLALQALQAALNGGGGSVGEPDFRSFPEGRSERTRFGKQANTRRKKSKKMKKYAASYDGDGSLNNGIGGGGGDGDVEPDLGLSHYGSKFRPNLGSRLNRADADQGRTNASQHPSVFYEQTSTA